MERFGPIHNLVHYPLPKVGQSELQNLSHVHTSDWLPSHY